MKEKRLCTLPTWCISHLVSLFISARSNCKVVFWWGSVAGWRGTDVNATTSQTRNQKPWGSSALVSELRWDKVGSEGL